MSRADELFSRYGTSGKVEVEGYDVSDLVRRPRKKGPNLDQNLGSQTILNQVAAEPSASSEPREKIKRNDDADSEQIRLAFAFQSKGWTGSLMDRLNTFSYKDLFKRRIAKVKAKTADIRERINSIRRENTSIEKHE